MIQYSFFCWWSIKYTEKEVMNRWGKIEWKLISQRDIIAWEHENGIWDGWEEQLTLAQWHENQISGIELFMGGESWLSCREKLLKSKFD